MWGEGFKIIIYTEKFKSLQSSDLKWNTSHNSLLRFKVYSQEEKAKAAILNNNLKVIVMVSENSDLGALLKAVQMLCYSNV